MKNSLTVLDLKGFCARLRASSLSLDGAMVRVADKTAFFCRPVPWAVFLPLASGRGAVHGVNAVVIDARG